MLTTEQEKKIAEYMYPDEWEEFDEYTKNGQTYICVGNDWFEPEGKDAMDVFKALVDECDKKNLLIKIDGNMLGIGEHVIGEGFRAYEGMKYEFNNESICLALIAGMESKL